MILHNIFFFYFFVFLFPFLVYFRFFFIFLGREFNDEVDFHVPFFSFFFFTSLAFSIRVTRVIYRYF